MCLDSIVSGQSIHASSIYLSCLESEFLGLINFGWSNSWTAFEVRVTGCFDSTSIPLFRVNRQVCLQQPRAVLNVHAFLMRALERPRLFQAYAVVKGCIWKVVKQPILYRFQYRIHVSCALHGRRHSSPDRKSVV